MEISEFQKMCNKIIVDIDNKIGLERDPQLAFTQLMEEIGELAKDINLPRLRSKEIDMENLSGEFADVMLLLFSLADMHGVNIEEAVLSKIEKVKARHNL
jgi:NTP pyrophosphatase (non-canonical NTP hydrolase)